MPSLFKILAKQKYENISDTGHVFSFFSSRLTSGSVRNWKAFCDTFPVSLHAAPPTKFQCVRARFPCHMPYYKKWREAQLRQRADYILRKHFAQAVTQVFFFKASFSSHSFTYLHC